MDVGLMMLFESALPSVVCIFCLRVSRLGIAFETTTVLAIKGVRQDT